MTFGTPVRQRGRVPVCAHRRPGLSHRLLVALATYTLALVMCGMVAWWWLR